MGFLENFGDFFAVVILCRHWPSLFILCMLQLRHRHDLGIRLDWPTPLGEEDEP